MTSIITHEIEERYPYPDNGERPTVYESGKAVTQEVRHTGDVKRLCLTVKTGGRIDAITCQVLDDMTGALS